MLFLSLFQQASLSSVQSILVKEELGKKDKELEQCNEEIQRLKEELLAVKKRNRRLCNILAQGESESLTFRDIICQ